MRHCVVSKDASMLIYCVYEHEYIQDDQMSDRDETLPVSCCGDYLGHENTRIAAQRRRQGCPTGTQKPRVGGTRLVQLRGIRDAIASTRHNRTRRVMAPKEYIW